MAITEPTQAPSSTYQILSAVAKAKSMPITELPPLFEIVDPDSLETILASDGVTVSFSYCGYQVTVSSDQMVQLEPEVHSA